MFPNVHKFLVGTIAAVGLSFGSVPAEASFVIASHNGSPDSTPHPGTGVAKVTMHCVAVAADPGPGEACIKDWTEFPTPAHEIEWQAPSGTLFEDIINSTGIPWTDYHWEVIGIGGVGEFNISLEGEPAVGVTSETMFIEDNNGDVIGGAIWLFFDEPFTPSTGDFEMQLSFAFDLVNGGGVEIRQYPTVPEPATLALMGLGLAGIGYQRRHSRKAA